MRAYGNQVTGFEPSVSIVLYRFTGMQHDGKRRGTLHGSPPVLSFPGCQANALGRFMAFIFPAALVFATSGCSSYGYEYVLHVECEGRQIPGEIGEYVGLTPPVQVRIDCDGTTKWVKFDPMGDTQTIRFGESIRVMIDGSATPRGFTVHIQRPGYKEWTATYNSSSLMLTSGGGEGGSFIRLDSIKLALSDSPQPSTQVRGGPEMIETSGK